MLLPTRSHDGERHREEFSFGHAALLISISEAANRMRITYLVALKRCRFAQLPGMVSQMLQVLSIPIRPLIDPQMLGGSRKAVSA